MSNNALFPIIAAVITALRADDDLMALIGGGEIKQSQHHGTGKFPLLTVDIESENPAGGTFAGVWRPAWKIDAFASDKAAASNLIGHLDENWQVPIILTEPITSAQLTMGIWMAEQANYVGPVRALEGGQRLEQYSASWKSHVKRR